jgi:cytochrome c oxidase assembly protein subunit 15
MTDRETTGSLFTFLVFLGLILTFAAVILSAYLRLEYIGLGCEEWPDCFAEMPVVKARGVVPGTTAGAIHRFAATLLGLIVIAITVMALRGRRPVGIGVTAPLSVFGLTLFLSILGYNTPAPQLPAVTLGNLVGGMAMLALLWWMGQRSVKMVSNEDVGNNTLKPWALLGLLILTVQIALGALTSANFAGPSCGATLLACDGSWASMTNLIQGFDPYRRLVVDDQGWIIADSVQKTLHMAHRLGALVTFLYLAGLALKALRLGKRFRSTGISIIALLLTQAGLGVSAVLAELPLLLVTAHNAIAAMLLLAVVNLNHLLIPIGRSVVPRRSTAQD